MSGAFPGYHSLRVPLLSSERGWWGCSDLGWCWRNAESLVQRACDRTAGTQPASSSASTSSICVSSIVLDKPSLRSYQINSKRVVHFLHTFISFLYSLSICFRLGWVLLIDQFLQMPTIFILREPTTWRQMGELSMMHLGNSRLWEVKSQIISARGPRVFSQTGLSSSLTSFARFLGLCSF